MSRNLIQKHCHIKTSKHNISNGTNCYKSVVVDKHPDISRSVHKIDERIYNSIRETRWTRHHLAYVLDDAFSVHLSAVAARRLSNPLPGISHTGSSSRSACCALPTRRNLLRWQLARQLRSRESKRLLRLLGPLTWAYRLDGSLWTNQSLDCLSFVPCFPRLLDLQDNLFHFKHHWLLIAWMSCSYFFNTSFFKYINYFLFANILFNSLYQLQKHFSV